MLKNFGFLTIAIAISSVASAITIAIVSAIRVSYLIAFLIFISGAISFVVLMGLGLMMLKVDELSNSKQDSAYVAEKQTEAITASGIVEQTDNADRPEPEKHTDNQSELSFAKIRAMRAINERDKS